MVDAKAAPTGMIYGLQAAETLNQAAPDINTWYTICDITDKGKIDFIGITQITTGETVEVEITVDGLLLPPDSQVAIAGTTYYVYVNIGTINFQTRYSAALQFNPAGIGFDTSLLVRMRKTTANGAGNLRGIVIWEQGTVVQ